jgi:DNA-binding response OmpR family regulator
MKPSIGSVLYIEDDEDTLELVTLLLRQGDYEVVGAEDYDDALSKARARQFDLFLIDNWMSGGSGIDLCKKLREFNSGTPILFYSGAAYESDQQQAFAAGAQAYLVKPVEPHKLIAEVSRLISAAKETATSHEPSGVRLASY